MVKDIKYESKIEECKQEVERQKTQNNDHQKLWKIKGYLTRHQLQENYKWRKEKAGLSIM